MSTIYLQIAITLLNLAFVAGGAYVLLKQTRRDLNGLGAKVRISDARSEERYLLTVLAFVLMAPEEKRFEMASWFIRRNKP